jgi:hypothetical protein
MELRFMHRSDSDRINGGISNRNEQFAIVLHGFCLNTFSGLGPFGIMIVQSFIEVRAVTCP